MRFFDRFRSTNPRNEVAGNDSTDSGEARATHLIDEGNELENNGRLEEAMQRYMAAVALMPGMARAHLNVGNVLMAKGDAQGALDAYSKALSLNPNYAAAHFNIGNANANLRRNQVALICYQQALKLKPDFVDAEVALGNTQDELGLFDDAVESYRRALEIKPDYAEVHYNLGNVLQKLGRGGALSSYRQAMDAKKDYGAATAQAYGYANQLCDWSNRKADEASLVDMVSHGVPNIAPFLLLGLQPPQGNAALFQRQASLRFAESTIDFSKIARPHPRSSLNEAADKRLRIGYLSADFHEHAVMHLLQGVLAAHERTRFEIKGFYCGTKTDERTAHARDSCDTFLELGKLSDTDAAARIAADGVDILVELNGFTRDARPQISALRPAPVIVNWLGYPGTLGKPELADYLVGDAIVTPPEHAAHFSETLALMPHCYQPNDRERMIGTKPSRANAGLPAAGFVFCSFNQGFKYNPETFDVWCRLLLQVPGSVLWMLSMFAPMAANLKREAAARGVDPERLIFAPMVSSAEHLGRLQLADLALDTFPYNSHTTGSDALWAGVPLVTQKGTTFASRVAASLLTAVGIPELVTHSWEDYLVLAKSLAFQPKRLSAIRQKLVDQRRTAPLFDTKLFTRDLERLYLRIWEQNACGQRNMIVLRPEDSSTG